MTGPTVMVVDNDGPTAALLGDVLREGGFNPAIFVDATAALSCARTVAPDAVVFELGDGLAPAAFVDGLRADGLSCAVLICSSWPEAEDVAVSLDLPFIRKPFDIEELIGTIRALVG